MQKALSAIARTEQQISTGVLIDILRGNYSAEVTGKGYQLILGFGVTAYLLMMIPFVSVFLIPAFVVSGILLYNEELETGSDSSNR